MSTIKLFLHVLVWVFVAFFSFAAPTLRDWLVVSYLLTYSMIINPIESGDWIATTPSAIVFAFMALFVLLGCKELTTYVYYAYCTTIIIQAELRL